MGRSIDQGGGGFRIPEERSGSGELFTDAVKGKGPPKPCGRGRKIEVDHCHHGREVVDVDNKSCTCKRWDISGIPCAHACAAISFLRLIPEDFVDNCYHRETFLKTYKPILQPVPGPQSWPQTPYEPVGPSVHRRKTERPKRVSQRGPTEPPVVDPYKVTREGSIIKCGNCGSAGHNVKTCKGTLDPVRATRMRIQREKAAIRRMAKKAAREAIVNVD